jgi:hypothetical protein
VTSTISICPCKCDQDLPLFVMMVPPMKMSANAQLQQAALLVCAMLTLGNFPVAATGAGAGPILALRWSSVPPTALEAWNRLAYDCCLPRIASAWCTACTAEFRGFVMQIIFGMPCRNRFPQAVIPMAGLFLCDRAMAAEVQSCG